MPHIARTMPAIATGLLMLGLAALAGCGGGSSSSSGGGGGGSSGGSSSGAATGSASLSWTAPTTNNDGSALDDLAGYHVYYGTSADLLNQDMPVNAANATSATVPSLASGTWYFAVAAVNSGGSIGELSNVASKTVN
ncbi:MAG: fibronectin type III domain-containing protein [Gammaproteobacteria bacterium]|nr:fibronectin type III domain-containing protein [Gammaproteobacteria bacterium]